MGGRVCGVSGWVVKFIFNAAAWHEKMKMLITHFSGCLYIGNTYLD